MSSGVFSFLQTGMRRSIFPNSSTIPIIIDQKNFLKYINPYLKVLLHFYMSE